MQKQMKINVCNHDKVAKALLEVQKKCRDRVIDTDTVRNYADKMTAHLDKLGVSKKGRIGIEVTINVYLQHFPNAYKYAAMGTIFKIKHFPSGWFLVGVDRWHCKGNSDKAIRIDYTDTAKAEILENAKWMGA